MAIVRKDDARQQEVAHADAGARTIVIAGPGTGKTEVAAQRLQHLFKQGLRPSQILVLSFSNSAVRTLTRRMESQSGVNEAMLEDLRYLSIRTFDSWTFRMLRQLGDNPSQLISRNYDANIAELIDRIEGSSSALVVDLLKNVRHVIVDEFQDLAGVRGALVVSLLGRLAGSGDATVGFTILGDDAQAIYGFSVRNSTTPAFSHVTTSWLLAQLRSRFPDVREVELDNNYRAVSALAKLATTMRTILRRTASGTQKVDAMRDVVAKLPELDGKLGYEAIADLGGESAAILTRTNGEALRVAQLLGGDANRAAMKVVLGSGGKQRTTPGWVGALLGRIKGSTVQRAQFARVYQHLCNGGPRDTGLCMPEESAAWTRLLHAAGLAKDATSLELNLLRERMAWLDAFPDDEGMNDGAVRVLTIHQSKGMEFDSVAILEPRQQSDSEAAGSEDAPSDDEASEAASVVFVAVTRAGRKLVRIPATATYPLFQWQYPGGGSRWYSLWNGGLNVELGQPRDVWAPSFVDTRLHDDDAGVMDLQQFLADQAGELGGRKIVLKKIASPDNSRDQIYGIHLQEGTEPGRLLGATTSHMTLDLLGLLWNKGFGLPSTLYNLRISQVVTLQGSAAVSAGVANEYGASGLWLGVQLHGVAFAKIFKRSK
jgi:DNA helicase II / ATP-dependent DNA helicase PcrA